MNKEQQRIAIAEACGWKRLGLIEGCFDVLMGELPPTRGWVRVPDYLNDLNAIHEAEKTLTREQKASYVLGLALMCDDPPSFVGAMVFATAQQRSEAFLKVIGKWEEQ